MAMPWRLYIEQSRYVAMAQGEQVLTATIHLFGLSFVRE
jgi:hypothetical protein